MYHPRLSTTVARAVRHRACLTKDRLAVLSLSLPGDSPRGVLIGACVGIQPFGGEPR
jgi:hypothetical protein